MENIAQGVVPYRSPFAALSTKTSLIGKFYSHTEYSVQVFIVKFTYANKPRDNYNRLGTDSLCLLV